ncbi:hypothetical protein ACFYOV_13865 [Streptomyces sp. NPDC005931]|uniref:hypothetical protein n=1 Tax=Streptomyces sp. NPDC005931 TaxID=3364737 RepID=UPI0036A117A9
MTDEGRAVLADADAREPSGWSGRPAAEFPHEEREVLVGLLGRCVALREKERP